MAADAPPPPGEVTRVLRAAGVARAAAAYAGVMLAVGFVLGVPRTLLLEPWLGAPGAVLAEAPFLLAAVALAAPWAARRHAVPAGTAPRLLMGGVALVLLVLAETALDLLLRGAPMWGRRAATAEGWIGLALMAAFALAPLVLRRRG